LSLAGTKDTAAIFGVYVRSAARGKGVAQALNQLAIQRAVDLGMKRVVLHSSNMAVNVYRRSGFPLRYAGATRDGGTEVPAPKRRRAICLRRGEAVQNTATISVRDWYLRPGVCRSMTLPVGTKPSVFEITGKIGVGGMGVVYRATDTDLKRDVAIKTLPVSLSGDADRLARFQREAHARERCHRRGDADPEIRFGAQSQLSFSWSRARRRLPRWHRPTGVLPHRAAG